MLVRTERANPDILQADGVEHSGGCFTQARGGSPRHRFERESFNDDSTETVQIDKVREFDAVTKRATGGNNGIG